MQYQQQTQQLKQQNNNSFSSVSVDNSSITTNIGKSSIDGVTNSSRNFSFSFEEPSASSDPLLQQHFSALNNNNNRRHSHDVTTTAAMTYSFSNSGEFQQQVKVVATTAPPANLVTIPNRDDDDFEEPFFHQPSDNISITSPPASLSAVTSGTAAYVTSTSSFGGCTSPTAATATTSRMKYLSADHQKQSVKYTSNTKRFTISSTRSTRPPPVRSKAMTGMENSLYFGNSEKEHARFVADQQKKVSAHNTLLCEKQANVWSSKYSSAAALQSLSEECAQHVSGCLQTHENNDENAAHRERPLLVYSLRALLHEAVRLELSRLSMNNNNNDPSAAAIRRNILNGWKTLSKCLVEALNEGSDPQHILNSLAAFGIWYPDIPSPAFGRRMSALQHLERSLCLGHDTKQELEEAEGLLRAFDILHRKDTGRPIENNYNNNNSNFDRSSANRRYFLSLPRPLSLSTSSSTLKNIELVRSRFELTSPRDVANRTFCGLSREIRSYLSLRKLLPK